MAVDICLSLPYLFFVTTKRNSGVCPTITQLCFLFPSCHLQSAALYITELVATSLIVKYSYSRLYKPHYVQPYFFFAYTIRKVYIKSVGLSYNFFPLFCQVFCSFFNSFFPHYCLHPSSYFRAFRLIDLDPTLYHFFFHFDRIIFRNTCTFSALRFWKIDYSRNF